MKLKKPYFDGDRNLGNKDVHAEKLQQKEREVEKKLLSVFAFLKTTFQHMDHNTNESNDTHPEYGQRWHLSKKMVERNVAMVGTKMKKLRIEHNELENLLLKLSNSSKYKIYQLLSSIEVAQNALKAAELLLKTTFYRSAATDVIEKKIKQLVSHNRVARDFDISEIYAPLMAEVAAKTTTKEALETSKIDDMDDKLLMNSSEDEDDEGGMMAK